MAKKQKRDAAYYREQLRARFPAIYGDLVAGGYPSVRAAAIAAGLVKPRTPLQDLRNAWSKSSAAQKREFLRWARASVQHGHSSVGVSTPIADADRRLLSAAKLRIVTIIDRRDVKMGEVMDELGFNRRDGSLGSALRTSRPSRRLEPTMIAALEKWLQANSHI